MKKVVAILTAVVICVSLCIVNVGAIPAPVDVYSQNIAFYDTLGYENPVITYRPASSEHPDEWQTEEMRYSYMEGFIGEKVFYFNFPTDENYVFYIRAGFSGKRRTSDMTYQNRNLLVRCYQGYQDQNGYNQPECSVLATTVPEDNAVFFADAMGFDAPVIHYCLSGSTEIPSAWKSAPMTLDPNTTFGEYGDPCYRFDFPREVFCFYISEGTHRTEDIWFAGSMDVTIEGYNADKDQYEVRCDARFLTTDPWFLTQRNGHGLYYNRLCEYLSTIPGHSGTIHFYDEVIHKDADGNRDWALIYAKCGEPEWSVAYGTIGNRAFYMGPLSPFRFGVGLYDVQEDTFYDLSVMKDYDRYDGLKEALDSCFGLGRLIGDMDRDNQLSILDVTLMQRCLARMRDYPTDDIAVMNGFSPAYYLDTVQNSYYEVDDRIVYYSDFDRDGERSILDATKLQRYLVGIQ